MNRRGLATVMFLSVLLCLGSSLATAGAKYQVTLDSGRTYSIEKVADDTFNVENSAGEFVGYLRTGGPGGTIQVFDSEDNLLGTADVINPDALEILDANQEAQS